jgi:3-deoxy-D-arabino-heptulosonate 7-phosphate (DAHP) synthase class II
MQMSDRVNSEITIEGGVPKVGYQRSTCHDSRPIDTCVPYAGTAMMSLVGKLVIPGYSNLDDVDDQARELLKTNATHLLYREVALNEVADTSAVVNRSTGVVSEINDNNIARAF